MSEAKRLLEQATALPWQDLPVHGYDVDYTNADRDLTVYAVNRLPDYEALREAAARLLRVPVPTPDAPFLMAAKDLADALYQLRGESEPTDKGDR